MIKEIYSELKTARKAEDHQRLTAQMIELLSGVKTTEELKEAFAKDGMELSNPEAERLFQQLEHARRLAKTSVDMDELTLVNGGFNPIYDYGPDGWVNQKLGIYRYKNILYHRQKGKFYIKAIDGCACTEDGWCWSDDSCTFSNNNYDQYWVEGRNF